MAWKALNRSRGRDPRCEVEDDIFKFLPMSLLKMGEDSAVSRVLIVSDQNFLSLFDFCQVDIIGAKGKPARQFLVTQPANDHFNCRLVIKKMLSSR
jgi:hypothetical protein